MCMCLFSLGSTTACIIIFPGLMILFVLFWILQINLMNNFLNESKGHRKDEEKDYFKLFILLDLFTIQIIIKSVDQVVF